MTQVRPDRRVKTRAESASKGAERLFRELGDGTPLPFNAFAQMPAAGEATRMSALWFERWMATGQEMNGFVTKRIAKDLKTMSRLATCRSPSEYATVWASAMGETAQDYAAVFGKLVTINLPRTGSTKQDQ